MILLPESADGVDLVEFESAYVELLYVGPDGRGHFTFHHLPVLIRYANGRSLPWSYRAALSFGSIASFELMGGFDADTRVVELTACTEGGIELSPATLLDPQAMIRLQGSFERGATLDAELRDVQLDLLEPLEPLDEPTTTPRRAVSTSYVLH